MTYNRVPPILYLQNDIPDSYRQFAVCLNDVLQTVLFTHDGVQYVYKLAAVFVHYSNPEHWVCFFPDKYSGFYTMTVAAHHLPVAGPLFWLCACPVCVVFSDRTWLRAI